MLYYGEYKSYQEKLWALIHKKNNFDLIDHIKNKINLEHSLPYLLISI